MGETSLVRKALDDIGTISTGVGILKFAFERCAAHRRDQFFIALQHGVQIEDASGAPQKSVNEALNALLSTEEGQELIFDAFRRVCFAKSRTYGPRIIGLLTAQLLNECRKSTDDENAIFAAAESLSDGEFSAFEKEYELLRNSPNEKASKITIRGDEMSHMHFDSCAATNSRTASYMEASAPNLHEFYGSWAGKLEQNGLIRQDSMIKNGISDSDLERDVEETPYMAFESNLVYKASCLRLFDLLSRAKTIAHSA